VITKLLRVALGLVIVILASLVLKQAKLSLGWTLLIELVVLGFVVGVVLPASENRQP